MCILNYFALQIPTVFWCVPCILEMFFLICFRQEKEDLARRRKDELAKAKAEEKRLQREAREKKVMEAR